MATKRKILIADDEPDITRTVSIMLQSEGYDVVSAEDGQDAVNKAYADSPDLIILDVALPLMDGRDVASKLRSDQKFQEVPIIFITAQTQKYDQELLKDFPGESCVFKPFDLYVLKDKIEKLFWLVETQKKIQSGDRNEK